MPEIKAEVRDLADTMIARFTPPDFVPGCEVKSVADIDEYTTNNGWIEAVVGPHNQQRVRYYGEPNGVQVGDYVDVEYFPAYRLYRVFGSTLGGTASTGGLRVSDLWESDFGAVALQADASGNLTLNGTRTLTIPTDLIHAGDTDNKIGFTDDAQTFTVGGVELLKLTEAAQDVIALGPGSGDIDIDFNGDAFLEGSSGDLAIGSATALNYGLISIVSNANDKIPLVIREKSGNTVYLQQWEDSGGNELASLRDTGEFFTSINSSTTGSNIGGTSFRTQNTDSTVNNRAGMVGLNSNGDPCGAYQVEFGSHAAGTGDLRMGVFSAGAYVEVIRVTSTQRIGMTVTSPAAKLDIDQNGPGAGIEVLGLHQADDDEPFISVDGSATAANLTKCLVDEGDVTTATRVGWFMLYVNDDGNQITDGNYWVPFFSLA